MQLCWKYGHMPCLLQLCCSLVYAIVIRGLGDWFGAGRLHHVMHTSWHGKHSKCLQLLFCNQTLSLTPVVWAPAACYALPPFCAWLQCTPGDYDFTKPDDVQSWKDCCQGAEMQHVQDKDCANIKV